MRLRRWTVREVADHAHCSVGEVYRLMVTTRIPGMGHGPYHHTFVVVKVQGWIAAGCPGLAQVRLLSLRGGPRG